MFNAPFSPEAAVAGLVPRLAPRLAWLNVTAAFQTSTEADTDDRHTRFHPLHRGSSLAGVLRLVASGDEDITKRLDAAVAIVGDFWRAMGSEKTIEQLSTRIEQAYEQSHLLFTLARIPKDAEACKAALRDVVERILAITNLGWAVLYFNDSPTVVPALRGQQFLDGAPPIDATAFARLIRDESARDLSHPILTMSESELAQATGAEILHQSLTFEGQRIGSLAAGNNGGDDSGLSSFETQLFAACAGYLDTFHSNLMRIAQQEQMFVGTLRALTASIDAKDPYTRGHSERVALLAHKMALALGLDEATAERYRIAGLIHDVGKIGVPERVLCKAGKLDDSEFAHIKKHPQIGFEILRDIPGLDDVRPGVLGHHERYDGRGYPNNIMGEGIPLLARVLALCDTFDAMSSNRSYRAKLPRDQVLAEITRCGGGQFDPALAATFVRLDFADFDAALHAHAEEFPTAPVVPLAA